VQCLGFMRTAERAPTTSHVTPRRFGVLLLLAATFLAGCMGDGDRATFSADDLSKVVLQPTDLSRVWLQFDEGRQASADAPTGSRADPERFSRLDGWKARYRRAGTASTRGPLVIESRADVFEAQSGAEKDLKALGADLAEGGDAATPWEKLPAPSLGDEALAVTLSQGTGASAVRYYLVGWRQDNLTASLLVNGFERRTTLGDVLTLARKQHRHLAAAK